MARIAINGFGRIGRQALKAGWGKDGFEIVAINDLTDAETLAYLLEYDSNYGHWDVPVKARKGAIEIDGKKIPILSEKEPANLPWEKMEVDIVIESTGRFTTQEAANGHIEAGAKRVVISAPAKGGNVPTYVLGANEKGLKKEKAKILNNASCTTNCSAPVMAVLEEAFGVRKALLSTVHGYTASQSLVDAPHPKDPRRGRAAAENMVPTTTGAAKATTETLPSLKNKFDGLALRVPIPTTSISDITAVLKKKVSVEDVNKAFTKASKKVRFKGILAVTSEPIVSSDVVGRTESAIVDLPMTRVVGGDLVKILAWYDNEWGYAHRLAELVTFLAKRF